MHFFIFLFGISLAIWPPENHQESRVLRVLGYYVSDNYSQFPWTLNYTDWSKDITLDLAAEIMEEIEQKIGASNIEIDILWFEKYCSDNDAACNTMTFISRKEYTSTNFHQYHDEFLETVKKFPENFPYDETNALEFISTEFNDWYRIEPLNDKHVRIQDIHFLGNTTCSVEDLADDIETIMCKNFWSGSNQGCQVLSINRSEINPNHQFRFEMEVLDAFHMEKFAFENYPTMFWKNDHYKNISFRCVTTENYPILLFVEDNTSTITDNEWIFVFIGAGVFIITISWASFGCCFSQKCVRISSIIPILLLAGLVTISFLLWFNYENEFMRFYMLPTCATLSALLLIYLPLACCCLRGRQRRMVIRPAKSEKDKVGLSKL